VDQLRWILMMNTISRSAVFQARSVSVNQLIGSIVPCRTAVSKPSKIKGGEPTINYDERVLPVIPGITEPHYLKFLKPQVPYYSLLNVQMLGYDHAVLDEFAAFVRKVTRQMKIAINSNWITPNESYRYDCLQNQSYQTDFSNVVNVYERNLQIKHLPAHFISIYIDVIQKSRPKGVTISVHPHQPEHDAIRYIPDSQLTALKDELKEWQQPLSVISERKRI
jgi:ribosomal protein S10